MGILDHRFDMWGRKLRAFLLPLTPCTPGQVRDALRGFLTEHIEEIGLGRASILTQQVEHVMGIDIEFDLKKPASVEHRPTILRCLQRRGE